jgi:predicted nucleotidyltransferase
LHKNLSSIEDIQNPIARKKLEELIQNPNILGIMIWGSQATGFATPDTDWDAMILVTDEFYNNLSIKELAIISFDESIDPKRLVNDFTYFSEACLTKDVDSPLDVDHWAFVEGIVIYDPTGKLREWQQKIARYPDEDHLDRLKNKFLQMQIALYYAMVTEKRGFIPDSKINIFRAILAAIHLWFTLQKSWTPPFKWWTKHVKKMGMTEVLYKLFCDVIESPSTDSVKKLSKLLTDEILNQGYKFPKDLLQVQLEAIHINGKSKQILHSYL